MKLIIWDFDGTLADTRPIIEAGMAHTLEALGLAPEIRERWLECVGLTVEDGILRTFGPLGIGVAPVLQAYRDFRHTEHDVLLKCFQGMDELLGELRQRGMPMAIATSKRGEALRRQLKVLGWEGFFDPMVTPDEVTAAKPDPESVLRCLAAHGLRPEEAVMVGDTPYDLEMAQRAGVPGIAVGYGFSTEEALAASGPRAYAADTAALRDILLAWS